MPHAEDEGESEEEIENLVEAVGCHARCLVVLAREVSASGVRWTTEHLHRLMASLAEKHPDDRERSLFASVELSLRRLPEATRKRLPRLAVFQGGGHPWVISQVLGLDMDQNEHLTLARQLCDVGLAEIMPYGHLRLHPALGPALDRELSGEDRKEAQRAWTEAMAYLPRHLHRQCFNRPQQAVAMTRLELPNLLAVLNYLHEAADAVRVVGVARDLEDLLQLIGRPRALARVVRIREDASSRLGVWSHSRYLADSATVDRLLDAGRTAEAVEVARTMVQLGRAAGEDAFATAAHDLAGTYFGLGRALSMDGDAEAAIEPLTEARARYQQLIDNRNIRGAAGMARTSLTEIGDCLRNLGRLEEAASAYEASTALTEGLDPRGNAVVKGQLGTVRLLQQRYGEAIAAFGEAREIFEQLGEPRGVAVAWHQIGMVYMSAGKHEAAERAYQESLRLAVQLGNRSGEAKTLNELGLLYRAMDRPRISVRFLRQSAAIFSELRQMAKEGSVRCNIAIGLVNLGRYDEARQEIMRSLECKENYGHAAEPWTVLNTLNDLERAVGNDAAAAEARERAIQAFLAYRRAGGGNHTPGGQLSAAVRQALATGQTDEVASQLAEARKHRDLPDFIQKFLSALQAILSGLRDPALASDSALHYKGAAEIILLLEALEDTE